MQDARIRLHGYPAETHFVETIDGYVLKVFRIPYTPKLNKNDKRPAILLQHGLFSNSDCWLPTGPDYALAYLLADEGFDVWLGNARGNIYSRLNTRISVDNPKFWYFDWHEIGTIDIPTMIDYILETTGEQQIHYAGHSQGTTVYFVMLSERPEYNTKIKSAHMLAPCAFFEHGSSLVFKIFQSLLGQPGGMGHKFFENMELMSQNSTYPSSTDNICNINSSLKFLCQQLWLRMIDDGYTNTNVTAMQILVETHPAGASSNQGIHYIQLSSSNKGRFCQMDYGVKKNKKIYGQVSPPDYKMDNIKAPTYLYSSYNDALCDSKDVNTLVANMPNLAGDYRVPEESFNHLDFVVAKNLKELVNEPVIRNILKHEEFS